MEEKENQQIEKTFMKAKIVMTLDDYPYSLWKEPLENQSMFFRVYLIDYNGIFSRTYNPKQHLRSDEKEMRDIFSNEYAGKVLSS
jgi:hypothetical protein